MRFSSRFHLPALAVALLWLLPWLPGQAFDRLALDANFDDKTPSAPIGIGGAAIGEPTSIGANLDAIVTDIAPGANVLRLTRTGSSTSATRVVFELIDGLEVTSGIVRMRFTLVPSALDTYSVLVRENDGSTQNFLNLVLKDDGDFFVTDAAGSIPLAPLTYAAGDTLDFEAIYDMTAGTHALTVNGDTLYTGRAHGIVGRGVGRLLVGYGSPNNGTALDLDGVQIEFEQVLPERILDALFDDLPLGAIGIGGAEAGEPVEIDADMTAAVVPTGGGNRALAIEGTVGTGSAHAMKWRPLGGLEIAEGRVEIGARIRFADLDFYNILVRESDTTSSTFLTLSLTSAGTIVASTAAENPGVIGTYVEDVDYQLRLEFDLDAGTVRVKLDDDVLLDRIPFGVADRGIGKVIFGVSHQTVTGSRFLLDDLFIDTDEAFRVPVALAFVQQPGDTVQATPIVPAVRVGALNVFEELVPDGTEVALDIESGPPATIDGNVAATVGGEASFPDLAVDGVGVFSLRATSGLAATAVSDTFESTLPPPPIVTLQYSAAPPADSEVTQLDVIEYMVRVTIGDGPLTQPLELEATVGEGLTVGTVSWNPGGFTALVGPSGIDLSLPVGTVPGTHQVAFTAQVDGDATGRVECPLAVVLDGGDPAAVCNGCATMGHTAVPREAAIFDDGFETGF